MFKSRDTLIRVKLALLVGVALAGFAALGLLAISTFDRVKVNGAIYQQTVVRSAMYGDTLPPALSLEPARLSVFMMADARDRAELDARLGELKRVARDFDSTAKKYMAALPAGKSRDLLANRVYPSGRDYLDAVETEYVPLLFGKHPRKAEEVLHSVLRDKFAAHREAATAFVQLLRDETRAEQKAAEAEIRSRASVLLAVGLATMLILVILGWFVGRGISSLSRVSVAEPASAPGPNPRVRPSSAPPNAANPIPAAASHTTETTAPTAPISLSGALAAPSTKAGGTSATASAAASRGAKTAGAAPSGLSGMATLVSDTAKVQEVLEHKPEHIGQVIGVIDTLADQTRLLASNAAIEVARARAQGHEFAAVADQLRKLAERTSRSSQEVEAMIRSIQEETKRSVEAIESGIKQVPEGATSSAPAETSAGAITTPAGQDRDIARPVAPALPGKTAGRPPQTASPNGDGASAGAGNIRLVQEPAAVGSLVAAREA